MSDGTKEERALEMKLLRCPFCGSLPRAVFVEHQPPAPSFCSIGCPRCGMGYRRHGTPDVSGPRAAADWNRRSPAQPEYILVGYVHPEELAVALIESGEGWASLPMAPEPFGVMTMALYRKKED